jgi:sortase A
MADVAHTTPTAQGLLTPGRDRRSRSSRALRALALTMIALGTLALVDAVVTLVWQEPVSWLYATFEQEHLEGALHEVEHALPSPAEQHALASIPGEQRRIAFLARELQQHAPNGGAVGRIVIPRINASYVIVKGTDTSDLERGPGVYPETSFPGIGGTTAIAGHRTTFLAPFRHIDALLRGSTIRLQMPYAVFTYRVLDQRVVAPGDVVAAEANVGYSRLVLSACTPLFSAEKRLLVYARLVQEDPRGAALRVPGGGQPQPIEVVPSPGAARRNLPAVLEPTDPMPLTPAV